MRDGSGAPISPETPISIRPADSAIEIVRYEFKHQASARAP